MIDVARFLHREHAGEAVHLERPIMIFLRGAGLAADAITRRVGLLARALGDHQPQQAAHLVAGFLAEHPAARRNLVLRVDLEQRRGPIDAAVEQRRIASREMQRGDGDAMAEADGHRLEPGSSSARGQRAAAFSQLDLDLVEEAHLLEEFLLPRGTDLLGDLRGADVGAFHHDLGDRAGAVEGVGVVDRPPGDMQFAGAIVHLAHRLDDPAIHRHRHGERLEGRSQLVDAEVARLNRASGDPAPAALGLSCGRLVIAMTSPVWMSMITPAAPIAENSFIAPSSSCSSACCTRLEIDSVIGSPRVAGSDNCASNARSIPAVPCPSTSV